MVEVCWQKKLHEMRKKPKREEGGCLWTFGSLAGLPLQLVPVVGQIDVLISYLSVLFSTFVVADQKDVAALSLHLALDYFYPSTYSQWRRNRERSPSTFNKPPPTWIMLKQQRRSEPSSRDHRSNWDSFTPSAVKKETKEMEIGLPFGSWTQNLSWPSLTSHWWAAICWSRRESADFLCFAFLPRPSSLTETPDHAAIDLTVAR